MIHVESMPSRTHGRWIAIRFSAEDHLLTEDAARELVAALVAELAKPVGDALEWSNLRAHHEGD